MVRISLPKNVVNIVMRNTVKMARAVVPKDVNNREVLQMGSRDVEQGFCECKQGMDDGVDGNNGERRIDFSPLEVVLGADLDRGWRSKAEGDNRAINRTMTKLSFGPISLKSP